MTSQSAKCKKNRTISAKEYTQASNLHKFY